MRIAIVWMHDIFNVAIAIEIMLRKSNLNSLWSPLEYFASLANIYHRMLQQRCSRSNWLIKVCNEYWFALKWFAASVISASLKWIFFYRIDDSQCHIFKCIRSHWEDCKGLCDCKAFSMYPKWKQTQRWKK